MQSPRLCAAGGVG